MANTTVYPFGTEGKLPASVGIVNDFTTGGADKALSAAAGKTLRQTIIPMLTGKPNTTPLPLVRSYFESGTLTNGTGAEGASTTVIRSIFIPVYPGATIAFSTEAGRVKIFEFGNDKGYLGNTADWVTGSGSYVLSDNAAFIRICVGSGTTGAPNWNTVKLSVVPSYIFRCVPIEDAEKYAAIGGEANTTPLSLSSSDFESGNLSSSDGTESASNSSLRLKSFLQIYPGAKISFSVAEDYGVRILMYDEKMAYLGGMSTGVQTGTYTTTDSAFYIRIVISSGQSASTFDDIALAVTPNYLYKYVRAVPPEKIEKMIQADLDSYGTIELPVLAPSPQSPANGEDGSDFNAETMTSQEIQGAFEALLAKMPDIVNNPNFVPRYGCVYETVGRDASDQFDIKAYVFSKKNRLCYRAAAALYAWKLSDTIYYTEHRSPRIGDTVYSDEDRTDSGYTVTAYNSTGQYITVNEGQYTRDDTLMVEADDVFIGSPTINVTSSGVMVYDKDNNELGRATYTALSLSLTYSGKTYYRLRSHDYHTDNKATIMLWGNEHGPQSDPNEASIVLYRLAKDLSGGCRDNPFLAFLRGYCKIIMIPAANPYGVNIWANSHQQGRKNANGVNINRNYDTVGWASQSDTDKGSYAGSEPETQFIMNTLLDFMPDIAVDIHCIGYASSGSEQVLHWHGMVPTEISKMRKAMLDYCSINTTDYGNATPNSSAMGQDFIHSLGISGGLIEMTAGPYATAYDGKQHTDNALYIDYMFLLNVIRMWYYRYDPTLDLRRLYIR